MQAVATQTSQVNTRVDSAVKLQAEQVLDLMGSSTAELVRAVLGKVARGARDYEEVASALAEKDAAPNDALLAEGWAISDAFYASLGLALPVQPTEDRSWDELFEEAAEEHFAEKGLIR